MESLWKGTECGPHHSCGWQKRSQTLYDLEHGTRDRHCWSDRPRKS